MKMKHSLLMILSLLAFSVFGQDTTYYDQSGNTVKSIGSCHHYEIIQRDPIDTSKVRAMVYFRSGQIKSERNYQPYHKRTLNGKRKEWSENGRILKDIDFKSGKFHGLLLTYWDNGSPKRKDVYEENSLVEGAIWDSEGNTVEYYAYEIMPQFPGGNKGLGEYLNRNVRYPDKSKRKGIEGRVVLNFTVEKDGSISKIRVVESVNTELDDEAIRVVKNMPPWEPALEDGVKIRVSYNLPIRFRLS